MVVMKSASEAFSGRMLFTFLDFGMVRDPVAVTHAGGALGGLLSWLMLRSETNKVLPSKGTLSLAHQPTCSLTAPLSTSTSSGFMNS